MPKPKPTEVIVHRIDVQPSLKESMDAFLIGKTATNAIAAAGSVLAAAGPALGVIAAWWLADRALDEVLDELKGFFMEKGEEIAEERYAPQMDHYRLVMATLESCANSSDLLAQEEGMLERIKGPSNFNPVFDAWNRFRPKLMIAIGQGGGIPWDGWGRPLAHRWKAFYPVKAMQEELKQDLYSMGGQIDKMPWPIGWIVRKSTNQ